MLTLDHIAIACIDLAEGIAWVDGLLGLSCVIGGKHPRYGTHNALLGLGDIYLEVIATDPGVPATGRPTWFALDDFAGAPRPANWICRTDDLPAAVAASPNGIGRIVALTRDNLEWQITVPDDGSLPMGGGWPTLIAWGDDTPHPTIALPDSGCRLIRWEVSHPDAATIARDLPLDDPRVQVVAGRDVTMRAVIDTPQGQRTLS